MIPNTQAQGIVIWVATKPVDMRKSFDSLAELVRSTLGHDPLSGSLFVFRNRTGERMKILWWDKNGLAILAKRIERGVFQFPKADDQSVVIDSVQLLRLLAGLTIVATKSA